MRLNILNQDMRLSKFLYTFFFFLFFFVSFWLPFTKVESITIEQEKNKFFQELPPTISRDSAEKSWKQYLKASSHWLYHYIPKSYKALSFWHLGPWTLWLLFGNNDDGIFGEGPHALWEEEHEPSLYKAIKWTIRNPLHNYTFYILGSAYCSANEFVLYAAQEGGINYFEYREEGKTVFSHQKSALFLGFHGYKPFISFRYTLESGRRVECFSGFRERGNFGLKFALRSHTSDTLTHFFVT